jgi:hypothetical protein
MSSSKQRLEANRANAKRSTGPATESGKARSKMNGLTHGLAAKAVVIEGEDPREFEALRTGLERDFDAQTVIECELVGDLSALLWRQRRVPRFEAAITQYVLRDALERDRTREITNRLIRSDILTKLTRYETSLANRISRTIKQLLHLQASRVDANETMCLIESAIRPGENSAEDNSTDNPVGAAVTRSDRHD